MTPSLRPKQRRSRETCDRIVAATRALLEEQAFDELSVQAIASRARASVGSFYNLFADKEALLPELYRRHCTEMEERLLSFCAPDRWRGASLADMVETLMRDLVALHGAERGLLRTLVLRGHCRPGERTAERPAAMDSMLPRIARTLAARRAEIDHPQPRRAAAMAVLMALATVREVMLYPQTTAYAIAPPRRELVRELTRAALGYLQGGCGALS